MTRVLIVYNSSGILEKTAQNLGIFFEKGKFNLRIKSAAAATVPDFTWADILIVGTDEDSLAFAKGEYREINRAFTGINLAGRLAGFFSASDTGTAEESLHRMFRDTEITIFPVHLAVKGKDIPTAETEGWARSLSNFYKEVQHA